MKLSILIIFLLTYLVVGCNEQYPASVLKGAATGTGTSTTATTATTATTSVVTDDDGDGLVNAQDLCPATAPTATAVSGCDDADNDGVPDNYDTCLTTSATSVGLLIVNYGYASATWMVTTSSYLAAAVTASYSALSSTLSATLGCSNIDNDLVLDGTDLCDQLNVTTASTSSVNTPTGATYDAYGCPSDSDNDTVYNGLDQCPSTPATATSIVIKPATASSVCSGTLTDYAGTASQSTYCGCADFDGDKYYELQDMCQFEMSPVNISSTATRYSNGCLYGFEIGINGGNTSKKVLHRAGVSATTATTATAAADSRCIIYNDAINNYASFSIPQKIDTATSELLCWLDIDEVELHQNGFTFQLNSAPTMCDFVWYDPYYFYQWDPGPSVLSGYSYGQTNNATYAYTSVNGKNVGYRRRAYSTSFSGASCSTCYIPPTDAAGLTVPLAGDLTVPATVITNCSNESVPGAGSTFCPFDHTASTGPNCDENYYAVVNYQMDYIYYSDGTKLAPGSSSGNTWLVSTSGAAATNGVCVDSSGNWVTCATGDSSCPNAGLGPNNKYTSSALFLAQVNNKVGDNSYCSYDYTGLGAGAPNCDGGNYTASLDASTGNLYVVTGTVCAAQSASMSISVSCGGSTSNCGSCTLINTATAITSIPVKGLPLYANLDSNPANDFGTNFDKPWAYATPVSCGGSKNNCAVGPGKSYVNGQGHPIGQLQSAVTGPSQSTWPYTIASDKLSNVYLANWAGFLRYASSAASAVGNVTNTCTDATNTATYSPQAMIDYTAAAATTSVSDPFKGAQPFYTFYCLDSGFDVKGVIRVQVRDWDRTLSTVSGTTYTYSPTTATVTDSFSGNGNMDKGGPNPFNSNALYSDYFDWDDFVHYRNGRPTSGTSGFTMYGAATSFSTPGATITSSVPACLTPTSGYPFPNRNL